MPVAITDEPTRGAVVRALWRAMATPIDDQVLSDRVFDAGDPTYLRSDLAAIRAEIDERLGVINAIRDQIDAVEQADLGSCIDAIPGDTRLAFELSDICDSIADGEGRFFDAPADRRIEMLEIYDAARRLLNTLPDPEPIKWQPAEEVA